jgi:hypothetical protein
MSTYETCSHLLLSISWKVVVFVIGKDGNAVLIAASTCLLILLQMRRIGGFVRIIGEILLVAFGFWLAITTTAVVVANWGQVKITILRVFECTPTHTDAATNNPPPMNARGLPNETACNRRRRQLRLQALNRTSAAGVSTAMN